MSSIGNKKPADKQRTLTEVLAKYPAGKGLAGGKGEIRTEGWRTRNKSWTDIYTLQKQDSPLPASSSDISASVRLNHLLTTRLQSSPSRLSAFQSTFFDLIQSLPSHSLLLQRLKSGYEEVLSDYQARLSASARLHRDVEDMMELQQTEKDTLLGTIRDLRREVGELNGALLRKTAKIAEAERRMMEMLEREAAMLSDPSDLETQKAKSSPLPVMNPSVRPSFLSPKSRPIASSLDLLSPIGKEREAFVSDQEASRAEIKESVLRLAGK